MPVLVPSFVFVAVFGQHLHSDLPRLVDGPGEAAAFVPVSL
jgi:hypothetical protein